MKLGKAQALVVLVVATGVVGSFVGQGVDAATVARVKCRLPAMRTAPKLPVGYPKPAGVTYTSAVQAGPSLIVHGYFAAGLDESLNEYKAAVVSVRALAEVKAKFAAAKISTSRAYLDCGRRYK